MTLDTKQQVLLAIYFEYQKDIPNMKDVTCTALNMDTEVFNIALEKLLNEGYITDVLIYPADNDRFYLVNTERMKLTRDGIELIETKFGIAKEKTAKEKVEYIIKKCGVFGYGALKIFGSGILK